MRANLMETRRVRRSRRRGAALVIVMIFAVGAIMLVTTMLTLTNQSVKTVGEMHAQKNLNLVLKTGLASALNEVTQNTDPGNDGVGALTGGSGSPGVAVTSPTGIVLGRYRVTVDRTTYSGRRVLTAVAAFPDFTSPTRLVAAEVEIATGRLTGAANPLSFAGEVDDEDKFTGPSNANKLNITAPDGDVAAVNVEDDDLFDEFNDEIVPNATAHHRSQFDG